MTTVVLLSLTGFSAVNLQPLFGAIVLGQTSVETGQKKEADRLQEEGFNAGFLPWVRESFPNCPSHASW